MEFYWESFKLGQRRRRRRRISRSKVKKVPVLSEVKSVLQWNRHSSTLLPSSSEERGGGPAGMADRMGDDVLFDDVYDLFEIIGK